MLKTIACITFFTLLQYSILAQGCSDAGFCTIGNFNAIHAEAGKQMMHKHEMDVSFILGTHGKNERFYQPQLNYRFIKKSGSFYEVRLPFNIAKNIATGILNSGIGDATITYNSRFTISKSNIDYSIGFRVSFTTADKSDMKSIFSYPMYLQSGLGTTDLLAVVSYDIGKYISIGTGVQVQVFQYNKNVAMLTDSTVFITGTGYRRKPDVLLKLTGHYGSGKLKLSGGLLSIFHLANDYYNTSYGKYILQNSQGTTINVNVELSYALAKNLTLNFLFAEPIVTRKNIPDGLARSRIYTPKLTYAF